MAHSYTLSAFGLKLIKAYEGYRPVATRLVTGQDVIGYGHKFRDGDLDFLTKEQANSALMDDLAPYIAMINDRVHAPLTQSQFDALVSLAFNIGPRAFEESAVLRAINNGRPLDAATAFDAWRKSTVNGEVYVVDALVRRRTAEKAMFLRPTGLEIEANRVILKPRFDGAAALSVSDDETAVLDFETASGMVDQAPYVAAPAQFRRREDSPAGVLSLSELDIQSAIQTKDFSEAEVAAPPAAFSGLDTDDVISADTVNIEDIPNPFLDTPDDAPRGPSKIAIAAAEVSDQLDRLSADTDAQDLPTGDEDAVIEPISPPKSKDIPEPEFVVNDNVYELAPETALDIGALPVVDKVGASGMDMASPKLPQKQSGNLPYWIMLMLGGGLVGYGGANAYLENKGGISELATSLYPIALMIGAMILLGALFYLLKNVFNRDY